jgi:pSer/pThr/pTyr-binding forkhead associated (FHA) protein
MSATVTLQCTHGPLHGKQFTYRSPNLCSIGRASDCTIRLPNDYLNWTVSRHHCLLEIDPPLVRVSDLGSLNGTFVNGEPIGHRDPRARADEFLLPSEPAHALEDGDELRVGENVFEVGVSVEDECEQLCAAAH